MTAKQEMNLSRQDFFNLHQVNRFIYLWIGQTNCTCERISKAKFTKGLPDGLYFSVDGQGKSYRLTKTSVIGA